MKNTVKNRLLAIILAIFVFVGVNLGASQITGFRLDLTEDKLFTLSDGTVNILKSLQYPVEINFYYSPNLGKEIPTYGSYATRVRDMLHEFESIAGDKLVINEFDPESFSETEDNAVAAGMQGVPLEAAGEKIYFGIAGKNPAIDQSDLDGVSIPFFQMEREKFLELDLTKIIYRIANPDIPKVGIITGAEVFGSYQSVMQGQEAKPWTAISHIQETFVVDQIYSSEKLREYAPDILLLIHPTQLTDDMIYGVDQYLMAGGKAVFFMDPLFESAQRPQQGMMPVDTASNLNKLFRAWGVEIAEDTLVGDINLAAIVNSGDQANVVPSPYVFWMQMTNKNVSPDDAVTAGVESLMLATAGRIIVSEDSPFEVEPLILSTEKSMEINVSKASAPDLPQLLEDFSPSGEHMLIAARLTGSVPSAFPDGRPEPEVIKTGDGKDAAPVEDIKTEDLPPHITKSKSPLNIILVADADMLTDRFWVHIQNFFGKEVATPVADNGTFLINALDNLAGSSDLISLRSRGTGQRVFTRIAELKKEAENQFRTTERTLSEKMTATEKQLSQMQANEDGQPSAEQEAAVHAFTDELLATRKELREVNHSLRKDVEAMEAKIRFINIGLMPILVAFFALFLGYLRMKRRRRLAP